MNIDTVRGYVYKNLGKVKKIRYNSGRGQIDEFSGMVIKVYKGVFLVESIADNRIRSFSYSDVLIKNLIFLD